MDKRLVIKTFKVGGNTYSCRLVRIIKEGPPPFTLGSEHYISEECHHVSYDLKGYNKYWVPSNRQEFGGTGNDLVSRSICETVYRDLQVGGSRELNIREVI